MSNFTLYEIDEMYLNLLNLIETGEAEEEDIQNAIDQVNDEFEVKGDGYAVIIKRLEANISMLKEEEKRLANKRRTMESSIKRLKRNLEDSMLLRDTKKFKTDKFSFNIQKNPASVKVLNESKIPDEYFVTSRSLDKTKVKESLKNGEVVEGAELQQTESLRIR